MCLPLFEASTGAAGSAPLLLVSTGSLRPVTLARCTFDRAEAGVAATAAGRALPPLTNQVVGEYDGLLLAARAFRSSRREDRPAKSRSSRTGTPSTASAASVLSSDTRPDLPDCSTGRQRCGLSGRI